MIQADDVERKLAAEVGHPGKLLEDLISRIQADGVVKFREVEDEWLRLMWSIDSYRMKGIPPAGMGRKNLPDPARLGAIYRSKGNWFATLLALLLQNRTDQVIRPRTNVQGFSQRHQIDLAWPARQEDPLVCVESKVTGAPAYANTPARGATSDFSNRRKELKFAATDLKLFRRQQDTSIEHWGAWRGTAPPKTYFLWAARLKTETPGRDDINKLIYEAQALVNTYLDGAGIAAWRENSDGSGYEAVTVPQAASVTNLDDVLYRIASEIKNLAGSSGRPPEAVVPPVRAVPAENLPDDAQP